MSGKAEGKTSVEQIYSFSPPVNSGSESPSVLWCTSEYHYMCTALLLKKIL